MFDTRFIAQARRAAPWLGLSAVLIVGGCSSGPFDQETVSACKQKKQYEQVRVDTLALHDYDGDGKTDMVVFCVGSNSSGVGWDGYAEMYKGDGEGGFTKVAEKAFPKRRVSRFELDNTRAGKPVLIVSLSNHGTRSLVRLPYSPKTGFGKVTEIDSGGPGAGGFIRSDVDGDGKLDLVSDRAWLQKVSGESGDTYQRHNMPYRRDRCGDAMVDLNGDGQPDLARGICRGGQIDIYIADGGMTRLFTGKATRAIDRVLGGGDFNGDGKTDLVVRLNTYPNEPGHLELALSGKDRDMTLSAPIKGFDNQRVDFVADFDGDGIPDIAYSTRDPDASGEEGYSLHIVHGQGGTTFGKPTTVDLDSYLYNRTVTDVNGDGMPDIVYSSNLKNNDIKVLLNQSQHA